MIDVIFSADRKYRYFLSRDLRGMFGADVERTVNFVMLNPSTADEVANDPTIERCKRRAEAMVFSRLIVTNLFGLRSTDPRLPAQAKRQHIDPIGDGNDFAIANAAELSAIIYLPNTGCRATLGGG